MFKRMLSKLLPRSLKDYVRANLLVPNDSFDLSLSRVDPDIKVVFDIGANVGGITTILLERFPNAIVYSFEPCTSTFEKLRQAVAASPHRERCRMFKMGFYDAPTLGQLHITSHDGANSLLDITPEYHRANPHIEECDSEEIELRLLDDFVAEQGIDHIDLIKVDVEGAEAEVLLGGRETLSEKVDVVFCEISLVRHRRSQGEFIRIFETMHECGFAPAEIYDVAQGGAPASLWRLGQFDCVFRRFDA